MGSIKYVRTKQNILVGRKAQFFSHLFDLRTQENRRRKNVEGTQNNKGKKRVFQEYNDKSNFP